MPPTKAEIEAERQKDLKRNVEMTEHKEDLGDMCKRLGTNYEKVSRRMRCTNLPLIPLPN